MQVQGIIQQHSVVILIDSGSTHCFLDASLADNFSLRIVAQPSLWVIVANGRRLQCLGVCHGIPISLGVHCFGVDFFVIPLKGFGAVLGVNWLRNLGPIKWDFSRMRMTFSFQERKVELQGLTSDSSLFAPQLSAAHVLDTTTESLQQLLESYSIIFLEPTGLSPSRNFSHRIILEQRTNPVVVRLYRLQVSPRTKR